MQSDTGGGGDVLPSCALDQGGGAIAPPAPGRGHGGHATLVADPSRRTGRGIPLRCGLYGLYGFKGAPPAHACGASGAARSPPAQDGTRNPRQGNVACRCPAGTPSPAGHRSVPCRGVAFLVRSLHRARTNLHSQYQCTSEQHRPHNRVMPITADAIPRPGSGGPGESRPRAPADPGVTLSRHRALLILLTRNRESTASARKAWGTAVILFHASCAFLANVFSRRYFFRIHRTRYALMR